MAVVSTNQIPRAIGVILRHGVIAFSCLVAVSCARQTNEPPEHAIQAGAPAAPATIPAPVHGAPTPAPTSSNPVTDVSDVAENSIDAALTATEPEPVLQTVSPDDIALEASEPEVVAPEAVAVQEFELAAGLIPTPVASTLSAETLDFSALVARLRKTKAVSLRTKIAVKNESHDLLEQFRAYHTQNGITTLADLRRSYDQLFRRLHSLLEDADPPLARDIDRSQTAIWELLADPTKFRASDLMAGA